MTGKPEVSVVFVCRDPRGRLLLARRHRPGRGLPSPLHSQLPATLALLGLSLT